LSPRAIVPEAVLSKLVAEADSEELRGWHQGLAHGLLMSPMLRYASAEFNLELEDYTGRHLCFHMVGAGELRELRALLHNDSWLEGMLVGHGKDATAEAFQRYTAAAPDDAETAELWAAIEAHADAYLENPSDGALRDLIAPSRAQTPSSNDSLEAKLGRGPGVSRSLQLPASAPRNAIRSTVAAARSLQSIDSSWTQHTHSGVALPALGGRYADASLSSEDLHDSAESDEQWRSPSAHTSSELGRYLLVLNSPYKEEAMRNSSRGGGDDSVIIEGVPTADESAASLVLSEDSASGLPPCQESATEPTKSPRLAETWPGKPHPLRPEQHARSATLPVPADHLAAEVAGATELAMPGHVAAAQTRNVVPSSNGSPSVSLSLCALGTADPSVNPPGRQEGPTVAAVSSSLEESIVYLKTPRQPAEESRGSGVQGIVVDASGRRLIRVGENNGRMSVDFGGQPVLGNGETTLSTGAVASSVTSAGDRAVVVDSKGRHALWDLEKGVCIAELRGEVPPSSTGTITISSPFSTVVLPRGGAGKVTVYDPSNGAIRREFAASASGTMKGMAVSADGQRLVAVDQNKQALVCDLAAGSFLNISGEKQADICGVASTSDGSRMLTVSSNGVARLWDVDTQTCLYELEDASEWTGGITLDAAGKTGLAVSKDGTATLWDMKRSERIQMLK